MKINEAAKWGLVFTALLTVGCSNGQETFYKMVPARATGIRYYDQPKAGNGVTFHVLSAPYSYQYVDAVRRILNDAGYILCAKSAIARWAPSPDAAQIAKSAFWINEMYTTKNYEKFFLIRVDSNPVANGATWDQKFTLATQNVAEGRKNMSSIREFCD